MICKSTNKSITTNQPVATDTNWTQNFVRPHREIVSDQGVNKAQLVQFLVQ